MEVVDPGSMLLDPEIQAQYDMLHKLGRGGYGTVYAAIRKRDGLRVAIKEARKTAYEKQLDLDSEPAQEYRILRELSQVKGVIGVYDFKNSLDSYLIIMERSAAGRDLYEVINTYKQLPHCLAKHYFHQVVIAVVQCHLRQIIHRDIKDENIMVNTQDHTVKLIDFGCSTHFHRGYYTEFAGTRIYAPPEWFLYREYKGETLTVWTLGVLLYCMLIGDIPFQDTTEIVQVATPWPMGIEVNEQPKALIEGCLAKDPSKRFSLLKVITHPWLLKECSCNIAPTQRAPFSLEDHNLGPSPF